ncbi:MAG: transposase [Deltaproteobacteria bacterium]|nr:transposase [Deltaproteobacteria bacterium]
MIYTENFKKAMVQKMLIPGGPGVTRLSREIGVNKQTLYNWRDKYHHTGTGSAYTHISPRQWTEEDKYEALLEAARLTGEDLGKWLREKGLRSEHIEKWQHDMKKNLNQRKRNEEIRDLRKKNKELERELRRKDKALAEMSALVVLKKKVAALWGDEES